MEAGVQADDLFEFWSLWCDSDGLKVSAAVERDSVRWMSAASPDECDANVETG